MLNLLCTQIRAEMVSRVTGDAPEVVTQSVVLEQVDAKDTQAQLRFVVSSEVARGFAVGTIYPADLALSKLTGAPLHEYDEDELSKMEREETFGPEHE